MRRRKFGILLLVLAIIVGCSNQGSNSDADPDPENQKLDGQKATMNFNPTGFPIVNEKITLTAMGFSFEGENEWNKLFAYQEKEKLTNIHVEFTTPNLQNWPERKNLAFSANELPDMFFRGVISREEATRYGQQGLLIPLEDLIDQHAPNIKRLFEKHPEAKAFSTADDGHIYTIPKVDEALKYGNYIIPNKNIMDELGVTQEVMPETTDEFYELLKRVKTKNNQYIPLSAFNLDQLNRMLMPAFGMEFQWVAERDGKVYLAPGDKNYKEYLKYLNRLYSEGLLDPNLFSQSRQEFNAKGREGRFGFFIEWGPEALVTEKVDGNYPVLPPLTSLINDTKMMPINNQFTPNYFAITSKNKHPEATIRWFDHWYGTLGTFLLAFGQSFDEAWLTDPNEKYSDEKYLPSGEDPSKYRGQKLTTGPNSPVYMSEEVYAKIEETPEGKAYGDKKDELYKEYAKQPPILLLTGEEHERVQTIQEDLKTYIDQMTAQFVVGKLSIDGEWNNYLSQLEKIGVKEFIEVHQSAYDRGLAALK